MKQSALLVFVLLFGMLASAQHSFKYFGPDTLRAYHPADIIEVSPGGYLTSGFMNSSSGAIENFYHRRYYTRLDANGDTMWTKVLNHSYFGGGVLMEKSNGDYMAFAMNGGSHSCGGFAIIYPFIDYYLETLSPTSTQISFNQYSESCNDGIVDIVKNPAGGMTALMQFGGSNIIGARDTLKIKEINAAGAIVSSVSLPDSLSYFAIEKANNGYWLARFNKLCKISAAGVQLWSKPMTFKPYLSDFCKVAGDSLVFACATFDGSYPDTCTVVKSDSSGNVAWTKHYYLRAAHVLHHSSGNYILTGRYNGDVVVLGLNSNGDSLWCNKFTLASTGMGIKTIEDSNGNLVTLATSGGFGESVKQVVIIHGSVSPTPLAPSNLTANPTLKMQQDKKMNLFWLDNSNNEDGFILGRSENGISGWLTVDTLGANSSYYVDEGLQPQTTYYYRVAAYNSDGVSSFSNTANATTYPDSTTVPLNLVATVAPNGIQLNWVDSCDNEDGFIVFRNTVNTIFFYLLDSIYQANVTSYLDTAALQNTDYYYAVSSFNVTGRSQFSNIANAKIISGVEDVLARSIRLFPNPSDGVFTLTLDATVANNLHLEVSNALGQIVLNETIQDDRQQLDLTQFGRGIYFLKVKMQDDLVAIKKIVAY